MQNEKFNLRPSFIFAHITTPESFKETGKFIKSEVYTLKTTKKCYFEKK